VNALDAEADYKVRQQFRQMAAMGFTLYPAGREWPALNEDEYVEAWRNERQVDACREYPDGRLRFWDGLWIRP